MNQYIITEEQLNRMRRCISVDEAGKILDDVSSHPYQIEYNNAFDEGFEIGKAQCETHHEELFQSERDKVLDEVLFILEKIKHQEEDIWLFETIAKKIKELR
jgi:hypothetical protein